MTHNLIAPTTLVVAALIGTSLPAHASSDKPVVGDGNGTIVIRPGGTIGKPGSPGKRKRPKGSHGGGPSIPRCTYRLLGDSLGDGDIGSPHMDRGQWYYRDCPPGSGLESGPVWVPNAPDGTPTSPVPGIPAISTEMLALQAAREMVLPYPDVETAPPTGTPLVVRVPTWWWVPNVAAPITNRVSVGPFWAEATATPIKTSWTKGDGSVQECPTLGKPFTVGAGTSGACTVTYVKATDEETAEVQVIWRVTWVGSDGRSGTLAPEVTADDYQVPVYERQAIIDQETS